MKILSNEITAPKLKYKILLPIIGFALVSIAYFSPVLEGKVIAQKDIEQYVGMSKEQNDYRAQTGKETYWTNSAFGGMPTYQLGARYPHNYIKKIDHWIRLLPRPADYMFLYFISFYILLLVLGVDYLLAAVGALCFGLSTYLVIILGVGHNAKAHAIGYFPLVFSGVYLLFENKKRLWGGLMIAFSMALELSANHYQMTYYLCILILIFGLLKLREALKEGHLKSFLLDVGTFVSAVVLSLSMNAGSLMATKEYTGWSTRGHSELTITPEGIPKNNNNVLDRDYITEYSYGIFESLNLFVPRLLGGSNVEPLSKNSHTYEELLKMGMTPVKAKDFVGKIPTYWGDQPIVAAPAYIGAICIFLFVLALFTVKGRFKHFLIAGTVVSLLLSWGKHAPILTDFMIDYFPMYDRFRAVSSIQVLLEMCIPILAFIGFKKYLSDSITLKQKMKSLMWTAAICVEILGILLIIGNFFDFQGGSDAVYTHYFGEELMDAIELDRARIYTNDVLRSLLFVALMTSVLWAYNKEKLTFKNLIMATALLIILDLGGIAKRYVNNDNFVPKTAMKNPFKLTEADKAILKNDTSYYRVWEHDIGLTGGRTSFFHKSLGGYHAAKPRHIQELFDYQIKNKNQEVLNMLNAKYIISGETAHLNADANGNAWFVSNLKTVANADEEMMSLDSLNTKITAVIRKNTSDIPSRFSVDSTAYISLLKYAPNRLIYKSENSHEGFAVFSEMHYPYGWKAMVDGVQTHINKVDYALRGILIPKGKHKVEFVFEPEVITMGGNISLVGFFTFLGFVIWGLFSGIKNYKYLRTTEK